MSGLAWRTALGAGPWGVAALSAVVAPLAVHVATLHHDHWFGMGANRWADVVLPWTGRLWGALCVLAIAGVAASGQSNRPGDGLLRTLAVGGWPVLVAVVAAVPAWLMVARLGLVSPEVVVGAALPGLPAMLLAGLLAAGAARWLPQAVGALTGVLAGGALIGWWPW